MKTIKEFIRTVIVFIFFTKSIDDAINSLE